MSVMMRTKTLSIILVVMVMVVGPASADLIYLGETPESGIDSYTPLFTGDTSSDTLWDYAYQLQGWTGLPGSPTAFGIFTSYEITDAWVSDPGWHWTWEEQILAESPDYGDSLSGTWLVDNDAQGIVFYAVEPTASDPIFHFQSYTAPYERQWAVGNTNTTEGMMWSAAPEPTTLLLTTLGLAAFGAIRRRRSG